MTDVVAIDNVVIPVSLTMFERRALESESAFPAATLIWILVEGKSAIVVVPRANQVNGLAVGRGSQRKVKLNGCHVEEDLVSI
jgi:hypothetical protein